MENRNFYVSFWIFSISPYIIDHAIHKPLFGKQESQKLIQESQNQAKNLESRRRKFRVADPSACALRPSQILLLTMEMK